MCVHNILLNDLVQQLLVSEEFYARPTGKQQRLLVILKKMQTPQVSPTIKHHLSKLTRTIYVCRHFRLSDFLSEAERRLCPSIFLSQTALPATQHGQDAVGAAAVLSMPCEGPGAIPSTANFKSAADRKVSFESSLTNCPPASPAQASVSSPPTAGAGRAGKRSRLRRSNRRNSRDAFVTRLVDSD